MKFVYLTFISIILLSTFVLADWQNNKFIRGDVNQQGYPYITSSDAYFILDYLFSGGQTPLCLDSADWNDDGRIDISDAIGIFNYLQLPNRDVFLLRNDVTPDALDCKEYSL